MSDWGESGHIAREDARRNERRSEDDARRQAECDGFYDAWAGYAPDPSHMGHDDHAEDYRYGHEGLS